MANDEEWSHLSDSIALVLVEHEGKYDEGLFRITKSHWVQDKERKQCSNKECQVNFTLTERKHHCRRCGEIFCGKCTMYYQRLSLLAQRDCDGALYKVCVLCFNRDGQPFGQKQEHMDTFKKLRRIYQQQREITVVKETDAVDGGITSNISSRLEDLTCRFKDHLNESSKKSSVVNLIKSPVAVPSWQIPKRGFKSSSTCLLCTKKSSLLGTLHHCRVCGASVCRNCSNEELLVYMDDDSTEKKARWAVINVTGCPNKPPEVRECLRICTDCHSHAAHIKLQNILDEHQEDKIYVVKNIEKYYTQLTDVKVKIDNVLTKYQELVDAIEFQKDLHDIIPQGGSTTKILAKYNSDTSDLFTKFAIVMQSFKRVRPATSTQLALLASIITAMYAYYSKNFFTFRNFQRALDNLLGPRVLEGVQVIVDYQAINCTFLALKQLGLECLELCHQYQLDTSLPSLLASCDEICKQDLVKEVLASGEDWEQHEENIFGFLRVSYKEKKLIVRSNKEQKKHDSKYMKDWLFRKCSLILIKVERQLNAKSRVNKFKSTKKALEVARLKIESLKDDV